MTERWSIHHGDVLERLPDLEPGSFDAVLCDPPYGLKFMGKAWDHGVPGEPVWSLVREALKPGAHLLAFGGTRTEHRLVCAIEDAGFEIRDKVMYLYGVGFPKSHNLDGAFKGYGTALKPAYEPCVVAMKPLDGTFAANAAAHGVAGLWIDGGRIPVGDGDGWDVPQPAIGVRDPLTYGFATGNGRTDKRDTPHNAGRWPANLILDAEAAAMLDAQSGVSRSGRENGNRGSGGIWSKSSGTPCGPQYGDTGGASRFFYTSKASTRERNAGLEDGVNRHPTLKPIDLCRYLATLILPPKRDTPRRLLVPFSGSGSEMIGALLAGWDEVVGIEREREYIDIAERRLAHWCASSEEDATTLFAESA